MLAKHSSPKNESTPFLRRPLFQNSDIDEEHFIAEFIAANLMADSSDEEDVNHSNANNQTSNRTSTLGGNVVNVTTNQQAIVVSGTNDKEANLGQEIVSHIGEQIGEQVGQVIVDQVASQAFDQVLSFIPMDSLFGAAAKAAYKRANQTPGNQNQGPNAKK